MHIDRKLLIILLLELCISRICAQISVSQKNLRVGLWAPIDKNPSIIEGEQFSDEDIAPYYIKKIAPIILSGMIYGWTFEYTPKDKARGVEEYFELKPVSILLENDKNISYSDAAYLDARLYCWVQYARTNEMMNYKKMFESVNAEKIHGTGYSSELDFSKGIQGALTDSAKDAIHSYARNIEKNKPKAITGTLLLNETDPSIKILNGKYTCELDFFLYVDKIIHYSR